MKNPFGHIDLRVNHREKAEQFYSALLPALGFPHKFKGENWTVFAAEGELPSASFLAITEDKNHIANENRIAFWVQSAEEVDEIGLQLKGLNAKIESGPRKCPEYSSSYYAVFFQDTSGNRLEVVYRKD